MNYFEFFTIDNKSGWECRKSKLQKNHPEIYSEILDFISQHKSLSEIPFVQQVYHFIFKESELPICLECKKTTQFLDIRRGYQKFCSKSCANKNKDKIDLTKKINLERYGALTPMQNPEIKKQIEEKNIKNFGNKNPFGSDIIKEKIGNINKERYGDEIPSKTEHCKNKYKKTCVEKYGVDSHWLNSDLNK
jgi:hypothetical protein